MFGNLNLTEEQIEGVKKILQSETDKVRTDYTKKIKELEKYKPKEKSPEEMELEERIKKLEEREKSLAEKENLENISLKLEEKGLPKQLAKFLNIGADDLETSIDRLLDVFKESKLNNSFIPKNKGTEPKTITKDQFNKMGYRERVQLSENNPDLYNSLANN